MITNAQNSLKEAEERVGKNHWKLKYHITAPAYWINDPNGFCFYKGEYHLFYQHHPYSPEWGPMHWGHVKSKDLASWEHLPIALAPSEDYDHDGCFSGSAIEKDGNLYLMYTGNVWTGDNHETDLKQVQCLAVSEDGIHFEKIPQNPVIDSAPEGDIHPYHFRDPKVWKHNDDYYCVLGSRTKEHMGQILLYRSKDLFHWEFLNVAARGEGNFGYMWECPDIFPLDGQDVLMMSPQGMSPEGHLYHNLHQSGYVLGKLDYESGKLHHKQFQLLDFGFDVYAPQTMIDPQGRRIMIAWMAMWESHMPEQQYNWAGAMTIPRELTIENDKIICRPVKELEALRENPLTYQDIIVKGETELANVKGHSIELKIMINPKDATTFGIKLRTSKDGKEETVLSYNKETELFIFDREKSGAGPGGIRKVPIKLIEGLLQLHIFVDSSSLEVFINNGEKVMTGRIYPSESSTGIYFFSDKEVNICQLAKWDMKRYE
ncbi:MAG TPA: glycoside hydrolase family 32 protein [Pseudoneobacillus sp.]|nr:glycoside hydrolase family 32 protein [Pseudoneobacillus sp.]